MILLLTRFEATLKPLSSISITIKPCSAEPKSFDFESLLPTGLTIAAAVIGYIIIENFARRREARGDLRVLVLSFHNTVESIIADSTVFYGLAGATPRARALAMSIKSKVASLVDVIDTIKSAGVMVQPDDERRLFRQAVTGGEFDSLARAPLNADDAKFFEIASAGGQLVRSVDLSYYRSFIPRGVIKTAKSRNK